VESHVHPRFAYKRFAADKLKGGSFVDLSEGARHNRQLVRNWFCEQCEKVFEETATAKWLDDLKDLSEKKYSYESFLLTFGVSLVYRYCLLDTEDGTPRLDNLRMLQRPFQVWRDFLLRKRKSLGPYTIHAFLEPSDSVNHRDAMIGGQIIYNNGLVITRTGPLVLFGVIARSQLTSTEAKRWALTEIQFSDGFIDVIRKSDRHMGITEEMVYALNATGDYCLDRMASFVNEQSS
jgi:hypothetical protein